MDHQEATDKKPRLISLNDPSGDIQHLTKEQRAPKDRGTQYVVETNRVGKDTLPPEEVSAMVEVGRLNVSVIVDGISQGPRLEKARQDNNDRPTHSGHF